MKKYKILCWTSTLLLTLMMLGGAGQYFFNNAEVSANFVALGFPTYIVIPLGIAKILGLVVIWFVPIPNLKEWAYAGFFFNLVLAFSAHIMVGDGEFPGALIGLVLVLTSYFSRKKCDQKKLK